MPVTLLITAEQLKSSLADPDLVVVDCRFKLEDPGAGERAYLQSHVAGAVFAHLDRDLSGRKTGLNGRHPLAPLHEMAVSLERLGVDVGSDVVAYDDVGGGLAAARLWWMLRYIGHTRVRLLGGGWQAWERLGGPTRSGVETRPAGHLHPVVHPEMLADADQVARITGRTDWVTVDSRAASRYRGEEEPIDPVAGHIPGARLRFWQDNLHSDWRLRAPEELKAGFERVLAGVAPAHTVFYCGSGVTSAFQVLAMEVAGLHGSRLYAGSWSEWCSDPARPVARGE